MAYTGGNRRKDITTTKSLVPRPKSLREWAWNYPSHLPNGRTNKETMVARALLAKGFRSPKTLHGLRNMMRAFVEPGADRISALGYGRQDYARRNAKWREYYTNIYGPSKARGYGRR